MTHPTPLLKLRIQSETSIAVSSSTIEIHQKRSSCFHIRISIDATSADDFFNTLPILIHTVSYMFYRMQLKSCSTQELSIHIYIYIVAIYLYTIAVAKATAALFTLVYSSNTDEMIYDSAYSLKGTKCVLLVVHACCYCCASARGSWVMKLCTWTCWDEMVTEGVVYTFDD